ncbi:MAG: recombinase RecB [Thermoprotei archaeon]|nr:MAG: recombinase RecB [Thermoprotei archaeon]
MSVDVIPVLHNVFSPQKVLEAARIAYGLGYRMFVVTKASGSAAQAGVPEAQKLAIKLGRSFACLPDLPDALEVLKPARVLLVVPKKFGREPLLREAMCAEGRLLVVFGGADPGLSRRELEVGMPVFIDGVEGDIGSLGLVAIALYLLRCKLASQEAFQ